MPTGSTLIRMQTAASSMDVGSQVVACPVQRGEVKKCKWIENDAVALLTMQHTASGSRAEDATNSDECARRSVKDEVFSLTFRIDCGDENRELTSKKTSGELAGSSSARSCSIPPIVPEPRGTILPVVPQSVL